MNLKTRRILYTFFILLFFCLAPIIILLAIGYNYDFTSAQITKNGLLILQTKPANVKVFIDNKLEFLKTPIKGANFKPGFYDLTITKPGYYSWGKKFEIKSSLTTFFQDVILFKKVPPVKIIDGNFSDFILSPDESSIVTLWQNNNSAEIWKYGLQDNANNLLSRNPLSNSNISIKTWSVNNKNLLFNADLKNKNHSFFAISFNDGFLGNKKTEIVFLDKIITEPILDAKWDNISDNIIYTRTQDSIYRIDIKEKTSKKIINNLASDFIVYDKILFFNKNLSCLMEAEKDIDNTNTNDKNQCKYTLDEHDYKLFSSPRGLITVSFDDNFSVIDLNNKKRIFQIQANNIAWNYSGEKMLYYNDFEVGTFSPTHEKEYKKETISRYGQKVKKAIWYPENHHLIVLLEDSIKIIELDARDKRNIAEISNFFELKNIYIDKKGENIYISGKKNNEEGIFQINIF